MTRLSSLWFLVLITVLAPTIGQRDAAAVKPESAVIFPLD